MALRFNESEIQNWAAKCKISDKEKQLVTFKSDINQRGYLLKEELKLLANWKSRRRAGLIDNNSDDYVQKITKESFETTNEKTRIKLLTSFQGVGMPTASAILHLFHKDKYPLLDFRAIWSLGLEKPSSYRYEFWQKYVDICRNLAERNNVDMRTLDRALWQYSKNNQPSKPEKVCY